MAKDIRNVLAEELRRVLEEFRRVEAQAEALATERKRLATIAQRLLHILRTEAPRGAERLIADLGLTDVIARLPGVPGRKPTQGATRKARNARPKARPDANAKAETKAVQSTPAKAPKRKAAGKAAGTATTAPTPLAKGTPVRMLDGKYKGWTGSIRWVLVQGSTISYTVNLVSDRGEKSRNQVRHGSLGATWEQLPSEPKAAPALPVTGTAAKTVRRRRKEDVPAPAPEAVGSVPANTPAPLPTGILQKGTPIKMLTGIYLGYTGVIASVQAIPGPRPDAIYTLVLKGPGGKKGRTSVKQGSLGRTWARQG